jgi:hypothetical protein
MLARQTRRGEGRENVKSVLLERGASEAKVDHWLQQAAPVEGFIGFALGRSIWWTRSRATSTARPPPPRPPTTTCASSGSTTTRSPARAYSAAQHGLNESLAERARPPAIGCAFGVGDSGARS